MFQMFNPSNHLRFLMKHSSSIRVTSSSVKSNVRCNSNNTHTKSVERSREHLFINPKVQSILKAITGYDAAKIFSQRPVKHFKPPKYLFLTDEELTKTQERAKIEGEKTLEMPPIMDPWEEKEMILEKNPEWEGFDRCNLVITDISPGFSERTRLIVVREPSGVLRRAKWEERYRMNQTYFPNRGRSMEVPKMFEEEHLKNVLDKKEYKFVLDRACIQFEPDDPMYIEVTEKVYDHVNELRMFDKLRSTRHFGNLVFYLTFEKKIDFLLIDMIDKELINDAAQLVQLFYILNPSSEDSLSKLNNLEPIEAINLYLKHGCKRVHLVDTSLKSYLESLATRNDEHDSNGDNRLSAVNS